MDITLVQDSPFLIQPPHDADPPLSHVFYRTHHPRQPARIRPPRSSATRSTASARSSASTSTRPATWAPTNSACSTGCWRDLRAGALRRRRRFLDERRGLRPRGRTADELHHRLVDQRGLGLPRLRARRGPAHRALAPLSAANRDAAVTDAGATAFLPLVHDRMTECPYPRAARRASPPASSPSRCATVPVMREGRAALERDQPRDGPGLRRLGPRLLHRRCSATSIGRDPTNVECFDIAQSNSEHSRHWFFKGRLVIDGEEAPEHLIALVQAPLEANPGNSVIAFHDNSSAIRGYPSPDPRARAAPASPRRLVVRELDYDVIFTAETHNFPSGVAPFPGAETGTGGRIRDVHATGRGSLVVAGTAAYCVGNLRIPGYELPWEDPDFGYPANLASPLADRDRGLQRRLGLRQQVRRAGDPGLHPLLRAAPARRRAPRVDQADHVHRRHRPDRRPAHREGRARAGHVGGQDRRPGLPHRHGRRRRLEHGAGRERRRARLQRRAARRRRDGAEGQPGHPRLRRSSARTTPSSASTTRAPAATATSSRRSSSRRGRGSRSATIPVGDDTLSVLEIWGAEYQENDALLLRPEHERAVPRPVRAREGAGRPSSAGSPATAGSWSTTSVDDSTPVDLELEHVLGDMPQKTFELERVDADARAARAARRTSRWREALDGCCGCSRWARSAFSPPRSTAASPAWWPAAVRGPAAAHRRRRGGDRPEPLRHHRRRHRHRRAADQGPASTRPPWPA